MSDKFIIPSKPAPIVPIISSSSNSSSNNSIISRNTYSTEMINGKERKVITKHLCIDSLFRKNYVSTLSSNFSYVLSEPINNIISMDVTAIEFPNSWYSFSSADKSNTFIITIYNAPSPADDVTLVYNNVIEHTIEIPEGNYQSDLLALAINNMFSNIRNGLEYIFFDINEVNTHCIFRTKAADDDTKGIFLDESMPVDFYFTVDFVVPDYPDRPLYRNAGWMLGFRQAFYTASIQLNSVLIQTETEFSLQTFRWYLESESSYGSNVQNYIFLDIDDFNKNFNTNSFSINSDESALGNNVIGRVSVTSGMNTTVTNTANDFVFKKREYFGPIKLERLLIKLVNKLGEPIALNGNDFSFVLEIKQLYS